MSRNVIVVVSLGLLCVYVWNMCRVVRIARVSFVKRVTEVYCG
jgi:hypothetical protein